MLDKSGGLTTVLPLAFCLGGVPTKSPPMQIFPLEVRARDAQNDLKIVSRLFCRNLAPVWLELA